MFLIILLISWSLESSESESSDTSLLSIDYFGLIFFIFSEEGYYIPISVQFAQLENYAQVYCITFFYPLFYAKYSRYGVFTFFVTDVPSARY